MLNLQHSFKARGEEVASKVIDGEAIIIDLANGIYYSMDKVGAVIWDLLQSGQNLENVILAITNRYNVTREQAEPDVRVLVEELIQENLLISVGDGITTVSHVGAAGEKLPYELPKLNIYRDMGDLLALDPPVPGLDDAHLKTSDDPSK